jgi:hypothetical protein
MYRFKKCYILARTSLLLLPFRYAAAVLYNSDNRRERGGDFNTPNCSCLAGLARAGSGLPLVVGGSAP